MSEATQPEATQPEAGQLEAIQSEQPVKRRCVIVCQYRSCSRNGAAEVLATFQGATPSSVFVSSSDCMGQCASGPTVRVMPDGYWYCRIKPSDVPAIVQQHLHHNQPVTQLLHPRFHPASDAVE